MIKGDGIDSCADIIYGILQSKISKNTVLVSSLRMDEPIEYACNFLISFEKELRNNTVSNFKISIKNKNIKLSF